MMDSIKRIEPGTQGSQTTMEMQREAEPSAVHTGRWRPTRVSKTFPMKHRTAKEGNCAGYGTKAPGPKGLNLRQDHPAVEEVDLIS